MKELQFVKKYLRYEKPTSEETEAITRFIRTQAEIHIKARPAEDLEELPAKFLSETLRTWRRKHPGLAKLADEDLWRKFTWVLTEFLFETRAEWYRKNSDRTCEAGMIGELDSQDTGVICDSGMQGIRGKEKFVGDPLEDELKTLPTLEALEAVEGRRTQFMELFDRHHPATEFVEREGGAVARLLLSLLRDVQSGQETAEEALEVLSVVLETHELRFKERQTRVGLFLALLEAYQSFDYQVYAEASPVTQYPACGTSEIPRLIPALTEAQVEKLKSRYGLFQGQLAEVFDFDPTNVPELKRRRSTTIEDIEAAQELEEEAKAVLATRRDQILERLKIVLMTGLEK